MLKWFKDMVNRLNQEIYRSLESPVRTPKYHKGQRFIDCTGHIMKIGQVYQDKDGEFLYKSAGGFYTWREFQIGDILVQI